MNIKLEKRIRTEAEYKSFGTFSVTGMMISLKIHWACCSRAILKKVLSALKYGDLL